MYGNKLTLPSGGHYGTRYVKLRRPKLGDLIDYFQSGNYSVVSKNQFIQSLCEDSFDLYSLPVGDREYIFTSIRSMVNSNVLTGVVTCKSEKCGASVPYILDLSKCKVYQLPEDFVKDYSLTFPITGETKIINVLTVKMEELLEDYMRLYEASEIKLVHSDLGDNLYEFARYACLLGDTESIADIDDNISFLRNLPWNDFELLLLYDVSFEVGPDVLATTKCDDCGQSYRIRIKTDSTFYGLNFEGLINKHRFLAKTTNIGFRDFIEYTVPLMDTVTEGEVERVREHNNKVKAAKSRKR